MAKMWKNLVNTKIKTHFKPFSCNKMTFLMLFLMVILLNISIISAWEWDNIKRVPDNFDKYKDSILIKNALGLGEDIATIKLLDNTDQALINGEMTYQVMLYQDYENLITKTEFRNKRGEDTSINGNWYYKDYDMVEVDDSVYEEECDTTILKNGTIKKECLDVLVESKTKEVPVEIWRKYNGGNFKAGTYTFKYQGKKKINEAVDVIPSLFGVELSEYAWWNNDWFAKRKITITENNNTELTNYSVYINVSYNSNMQSDFADLRFTESTETSEINYWIENYTESVNAYVWIYVPSIASGTDTDVYMYYSNEDASSSSDFNTAFAIADDFEVNTATKWTHTTTNTICTGHIVADGKMYLNFSGSTNACHLYLNNIDYYNVVSPSYQDCADDYIDDYAVTFTTSMSTQQGNGEASGEGDYIQYRKAYLFSANDDMFSSIVFPSTEFQKDPSNSYQISWKILAPIN